MDAAQHAPLFVPDEEPRAKRKFGKAIAKAIVNAGAFLQEHPEGVPDSELEAWSAGIDGAVLGSYQNNTQMTCAVTGAFYCAISSGMTGNATRRYIGALGQSRLTMALMLLNSANREALLKYSEINRSLRGARAVAMLAAALSAAGGRCLLPTAHEDADLKIDLLCEYKGRLACLQVKLGDRTRSHVATDKRKEERKFVSGVERFNAVNGTQAIPLWVSTVTFADLAPRTMCSDASVAFAAQILSHLSDDPLE